MRSTSTASGRDLRISAFTSAAVSVPPVTLVLEMSTRGPVVALLALEQDDRLVGDDEGVRRPSHVRSPRSPTSPRAVRRCRSGAGVAAPGRSRQLRRAREPYRGGLRGPTQPADREREAGSRRRWHTRRRAAPGGDRRADARERGIPPRGTNVHSGQVGRARRLRTNARKPSGTSQPNGVRGSRSLRIWSTFPERVPRFLASVWSVTTWRQMSSRAPALAAATTSAARLRR